MFLREKLRVLNKLVGSSGSCIDVSRDLKQASEGMEDMRNKSAWIRNEMKILNARIEENGFKMIGCSHRRKALELDFEKARAFEEVAMIESKITELRDREERARRMILSEETKNVLEKPEAIDLEREKLLARKHALMGRRGDLCKKIGVSDFGNLEKLYEGRDKDEIIAEIIRINEETKRLGVVDRRAFLRWDDRLDQRRCLRGLFEELKDSRRHIAGLIHEFDRKKTEIIKSAISTVEESFPAFYSKLTGGETAELRVSEGNVGVVINDCSTNVSALSQRATIALSLMFSIHKINALPFYVFDEVDANLDTDGRVQAAKVVSELSKGEINSS